MKKLLKVISAGIALSAAFASTTLFAADNLVTNGDFEDVGSFTGNYEYYYNLTDRIPNWNCTPACGVCNNNGTWVNSKINVGTYALFMQNEKNYTSSHFYQDVTISETGEYRIEFDYAARPSHQDQLVSVYFGDVTSSSDVTDDDLLNTFYSRYDVIFTHYTRRVTVTSAGTYRLKIAGTASGDVATAFDNITITKISDPVNEPDTYISYAESTGSQYIDPGLQIRPDMRVEADIDYISGSYAMGISWHEGYPIDNNGGYIGGWIMKSGHAKTTVPLNSGRYLIAGEGSYTNSYIMSVNGVQNGTYSGTCSGARGHDGNFYLFYANHSSGAALKMYGLKLYLDGYLVRDFVPGIKNNVVGLYDKEHDVWYAPSGTLTAGPAITSGASFMDENAYVDGSTIAGAAWNNNVSNIFVHGKIVNGCVVVQSNLPGPSADQAYGTNYVNESATFSAPATDQVVNNVNYRFVGYKVERYNFSSGEATGTVTQIGEYDTNSFSYTNCAEQTAVRLTWLWNANVCSIGGAEYSSIAAALASGDATAENPVTLLADIDEDVVVSAGSTFYFSRGEHSFTGTITLSGAGATFVNCGGELSSGTVVASAGYRLEQDGSTYTAYATDVYVNGTAYATLDAAIDAGVLVPGSTLTLNNNLDLTSSGPVTFLRGVTLDCNGYTFTAYRRLEYVVATGSQYIDSGVKGPANANGNSVEVIADLDWISGQIMAGHSWNEFWPLGSKTSDDNICGSLKSKGVVSDVAKNTGRHDIDALATIGSTFVLTVDGTAYESTDNITGYDAWDGRSMYIFAQWGSGAECYSSGKLYGMKMKVNGELKGEFIPALQITNSDPNGTPGLWDTVSASFIGNSGLTAGPDISDGAILMDASAAIADATVKSEVTWNSTVSNVVENGKIVNGCVLVQSNLSDPKADQANGTYYVNDNFTFTAPSTNQTINGVEYTFIGYKVERYNFASGEATTTLTQVGEYEGNSFAYTNTAALTAVRLTWMWSAAVCEINGTDYESIAVAVASGTSTAEHPAILLVDSSEEVEIPAGTTFYFSLGEASFTGTFTLKGTGSQLVDSAGTLSSSLVLAEPGYRIDVDGSTYSAIATEVYVGETPYTTFDDAVASGTMTPGSTLKLNKDLDLTSRGPIAFPAGVTVDCNGYAFAAYRLLEYVESTGSQYIDTGIYAAQSTESAFVVDADIDWISGNTVLGHSHHNYEIISDSNSYYGSTVKFGTSNSATAWDTEVSKNTGRHHIVVTSLCGANITFKVDDTTYTSDSVLNNVDIAGNSLSLFARHSGSSYNNNSSAKIYGMTLSQGGTLVRDYVPCLYVTRDNLGGTAGLWDNVASAFSGHSDLTAGPDIRDGATLMNADASITGATVKSDVTWNNTVAAVVNNGKIMNGCVVVQSNFPDPTSDLANGTYYVNDNFAFTAPTTNQTINGVEYAFAGYKVERYNFSAGEATETLTTVGEYEGNSFAFTNSAAQSAMRITWQWTANICAIGDTGYQSIAEALASNTATAESPVTLRGNTFEAVEIPAGTTLYFTQGDVTFSGTFTLAGLDAKLVNTGTALPDGIVTTPVAGCSVEVVEGTYTAIATAVFVNDVPYATIDTAVEAEALVPGATMKLNDNIDLTSSGPVTFLRGVTLDYNGYTFAAYRRLEYVEATGSQSIDTGIKPAQSTESAFLVDADVDWISGTTVLGHTYHNYEIISDSNSYYGSTVKFGTSNSATTWNTEVSKNTGRHHIVVTSLCGANITFKVDDTTYTSDSALNNVNIAGNSLSLFARHNGSSYDNPSSAKLYGMTLSQGGTLVRDYVPCLYVTESDANGTQGLWDGVEKGFTANTGLTAGPDIRDGATLIDENASIASATIKSEVTWNSTVASIRNDGKIVNGCVVVASKFPGQDTEVTNGVYYVNTDHTFSITNIVVGDVEYAPSKFKVERYNFAAGAATDTLTTLCDLTRGDSYSYTNSAANTAVKLTWQWREYVRGTYLYIR